VGNMGLLFSAMQFAAVFDAATRDSSSAVTDVTEAQLDATVWLEDETATLEEAEALGYGRMNYQGRIHAVIHSGLPIAGREGAISVASAIVINRDRNYSRDAQESGSGFRAIFSGTHPMQT
jgi:hypothetical protein